MRETKGSEERVKGGKRRGMKGNKTEEGGRGATEKRRKERKKR